MRPTANPQQVIDRLAERALKAPAHCRLGSEARRRRGGACSACRPPQEFEIDQAIAQLIESAALSRAGVCPYQVVSSHLVAGLTLGPEVSRARAQRAGQLRVDPVVEVKGARKRIRTLLASGLSRENIEAIAISNKGAWWQALDAVLTAERTLDKALELFQSIPVKPGRSPRGRSGALHNQAVARAMVGAWYQLTGRLPAKDNSKFHDLLQAAIVSIFGHPAKEPNLESLTKKAVERTRKDAASGS